MIYNVSFDHAAIILALILLCIYLLRPKFKNMSAKIFQMLLTAVFIASISEMFTCKIIENPTNSSVGINYLIICIFLYSINVCSILYYRYVVEITANGRVPKWEHRIFLFTLVLDLVIISLSPFTKLTFYFDENQVYRHGPLFNVLYVVAFFVLLIAGIKFFRYRKRLNQIQRFSVMFFYVVNIGAILFERIYTRINILTFVTTLYMFLLYVSLQNPEYYLDSELGCYNQEAFKKVCEQRLLNANRFIIISFYAEGYEYINQAFGVERGTELIKYISKYFIKNLKHENFFHIADSNFVYITNHKLDYAKKVYQKVWSDFNKPYEINNARIPLQPRGCAILAPNVVNTAKDVLDAVLFSQKKELPNLDGSLYYLDSKFLRKKHRKERIAQIIKEKLVLGGFEVYYLPIYDMKEKRIVGAEALVRLQDEGLGEIQPDEFIAIAEEYGLILDIDQTMFEKVCKFVHFIDSREYAIKLIEVNLSTIEIMQGESAEKWLDVLRKNKVHPNRINFEIKESVCVAAKESLAKNMEVLKRKGCTFSIDNYGTGFSNVTDLLKLEFDMIKIDKTILWEAMKTKAAMNIFENMVSMFQKLEYDVLVTGVETKEEKKIVEQLDVNYLQGFIISKPLNEKEFLKLLDDQNK